jgi:DNA polymerase I-like protein with 3'-5' exonuclease and polymerase domains
MAKKVTTWEDLQKDIKKIVSALNKDENLKLAAAANPLFALSELGYEIEPSIKAHVEDKMRFKTRQVTKLESLRKKIFRLAKQEFDIRNLDELRELLFVTLGLTAYDDKGCEIAFLDISYQKGINTDEHTIDPLSELEDLHPVIEPLLEYRAIDFKTHPFSDKRTYQRIRDGETALSTTLSLKIKTKA